MFEWLTGILCRPRPRPEQNVTKQNGIFKPMNEYKFTIKGHNEILDCDELVKISIKDFTKIKLIKTCYEVCYEVDKTTLRFFGNYNGIHIYFVLDTKKHPLYIKALKPREFFVDDFTNALIIAGYLQYHPEKLELKYIDWDIIHDEYSDAARAYFREYVAAEMMARVWHPRNIARFPDWGVD